jgi:cysteine desulfurase
MTRYYFDHNATTPVCDEALQAMVTALHDVFANPSSVHQDGQLARQQLEAARADICRLVGCQPKELVLLSGGTEADNLALFGALRASTAPRRHLITTRIEHPAVLNACAQLEREGVEVTYLSPTPDGYIEPSQIRRALQPHTVLISVMHANNETGVLQPIEEIGALARQAGVLFHSDGVQAVGKLPLQLAALPVDLYSFSGHKLYAPKGVGALYVRQGVTLQPIQFGGRHERSLRAGTENVPGAVALAAAARVCAAHQATEHARLASLRERLEEGIRARVPDIEIHGAAARRLPNTTNIAFQGVDGEAMVIALDLRGFAVSTGAACSSGAVQPSHVLTAMGLSAERARSSLRFSLGRGNTPAHVDALIDAVADVAAHLRRLSPTYV